MECGIIKFSFLLKQSGLFNLVVSVNEKRVRDLLRFTAEDNPAAVEPEEEVEEVDWRAREAEEERAEKEREKKFLAQKRKEKEDELRRAQEELKQKMNLKTQERADAALRAKIVEVEARKMRDSQMKKGLADARVGGGYDIDKLSKLRGEREPVVSNKSPGQLSTSVSQNKDSSTTLATEVVQNGATEGGAEVVYQYGRGLEMGDSQRFMSQKDDGDYPEYVQNTGISQQELGNISSSKRPGSNSFKIREVSIKNRGSRPGSRMQDSTNFEQAARQSMTSSMIGPMDPTFERGNSIILNMTNTKLTVCYIKFEKFSFGLNSMIGHTGQRPDSGLDKRQPVRVIVKTGDNFYQKDLGQTGELSPAQLVEAMRESRDGGSRNLAGSGLRDRLAGAANPKAFARGSSLAGPPAKGVSLVRGVSQDKGRTANGGSSGQDMSNIPTGAKRSKAGLSVGKKATDPYKMPQIARSNAFQPLQSTKRR